MPDQRLDRQTILTALSRALEQLPYTNALWEGGAAAFERVDQWSDIDLVLDVQDEHVSEAFSVFESALLSLSPIEILYEVPQPTWHGHRQKFYRLQDASPYLLLDFTIVQSSNSNKFLEPAVHGTPLVHFDKTGVIERFAVDGARPVSHLPQRLITVRKLFDLFQVLVLKEIQRGNSIEALAFYTSFTLRPLIEVLRMQHTPARSGFFSRHIYYDLPPEIVKRLETFFFISDLQTLRAKQVEAEAWFTEVCRELDDLFLLETNVGENAQ